MPNKRAGSSPAPGTMTKELFRELNPKRHGRDSTGMCYVCGHVVVPGKVFCRTHSRRWQLTKPKAEDIDEPTIYWTLRQHDFNGRGKIVAMDRKIIAEWCNWKHA